MTSEGVGARKGIGFGGNWRRTGYAKEIFFFFASRIWLRCGIEDDE